MLVLFIYITRLASNEIFLPSNKIHREVGRARTYQHHGMATVDLNRGIYMDCWWIIPIGDSQNTCPTVSLSITYPSVIRQGVINCNNIIPYTWYRHRLQFLVFRCSGCSFPAFCVVTLLSLVCVIPASYQQCLACNTTECGRLKYTHIQGPCDIG